MKKAVVTLLAIPLIGMGVLILLYYIGILLYISPFFKDEPAMVLMPEGHEGMILIVYSQENGAPVKYEGDFRVYEIPADGVLLTQFTPRTRSATFDFYYVDSLGKRNQILEPDFCKEPIKGDPPVVCEGGWATNIKGREDVPIHDYFVVAPPSKYEEVSREVFWVEQEVLLSLMP